MWYSTWQKYFPVILFLGGKSNGYWFFHQGGCITNWKYGCAYFIVWKWEHWKSSWMFYHVKDIKLYFVKFLKTNSYFFICLIFDYLNYTEQRQLIIYSFKNDGNSKLNAVLPFPDNMPFSNVSNYRCFLTCVWYWLCKESFA